MVLTSSLLPHNGPSAIPLEMLILFVSAKVMAEIAERLHQPGIVGEIFAGVLIGPSVLGWLTPGDFLSAMAQIGAMFLLFRVGLEVRSSELMKIGGTALLVACSGVVLPFILGSVIMYFWRAGAAEAIFVGASLVATSVGITAQVLAAKGLLNEVSSRIILAAAVIDDVLGLLVLAAVSSLTRGKFDVWDLVLTASLATIFTLGVAKWGSAAMGRVLPKIQETLRGAESRFAVSISLLLGFAVVAQWTGVAPIVGAFLAGLAVSDTSGPRQRDLVQGISEFLVPFFLAGIGLQVDLSAFGNLSTAVLAIVILVAAVLSKFLGCGLGALALGHTEAFRIGVGMIPRGEVGMIVAQIGLGLGILSRSTYGVVVFMSVATTIIAPPLIKVAYRSLSREGEPEGEVLRLG